MFQSSFISYRCLSTCQSGSLKLVKSRETQKSIWNCFASSYFKLPISVSGSPAPMPLDSKSSFRKKLISPQFSRHSVEASPPVFLFTLGRLSGSLTVVFFAQKFASEGHWRWLKSRRECFSNISSYSEAVAQFCHLLGTILAYFNIMRDWECVREREGKSDQMDFQTPVLAHAVCERVCKCECDWVVCVKRFVHSHFINKKEKWVSQKFTFPPCRCISLTEWFQFLSSKKLFNLCQECGKVNFWAKHFSWASFN